MIIVTETVERSSWEPSGAAESAVHDDFGTSDIDVDIDDEGSASAESAGSDSEY